jgi:hypothetical protein
MRSDACGALKTAAALLAAIPLSAFGDDAPAPLPHSWALAAIDGALPEPRQPRPDHSAFIEASKSYGIPAAEILGFQALLHLYDRHHYGCCDYETTMATVRRNLHSSWGVDRDPFSINQLGHPYAGGIYHGIARSAGLDYWESAAYTFAASAVWEIAGESTSPSRNDQIATGIGGTFLGEALFRMANLALEHEGLSPTWREIAATVISPPVGFNRLAFGDRFRAIYPSRGPVYFARLQVGFSGSERGELGGSTVELKRNEGLVDFNLEYGLPGKDGYEYTRPFDYFTFQATASSANGFENAMTRGLLAGRDLDPTPSSRAVWGLFGSYDYVAPQTYRVSSTGLSLGAVAQWRASEKVNVLGSLLLGAGYTAVGTIGGASQTDYHYGLAPQALAQLRVVYGSRLAFDITGREWYVSRVLAAQRGGHDNIARLDAALTWRVYGRHGISLKYLGNRRDANYPDLGGTITQKRETLGVFYTLLGHDRFGAVDWR